MVCVYCGKATSVTNSRAQRRNNTIWRRRRCLECSSIFTSIEQPDFSATFMVARQAGEPEPLNRDKLFLSIYHSCKHRQTALEDATALTKIILAQLLEASPGPLIQPSVIQRLTHRALGRFDQTAATVYAAYHPAAQ